MGQLTREKKEKDGVEKNTILFRKYKYQSPMKTNAS